MQAKDNSTFLWFDQRTKDDDILNEIEKQAETVTRLHILSPTFMRDKRFTGLELPNLTELLLEHMTFQTSSDWSFLRGLKKLNSFIAGSTRANDQIIAALAEMPWWENLTHLDLTFFDLAKTENWHLLWEGRKLSLELLCLRYLDSAEAGQILRADLSNLQYLILGITKGVPFLHQLTKADLPNLEDLELRHADIPADEVLQFIQAEYPKLPRLKRIGKTFYSDRKYDVCDWNGAVVDWDYEQLSDGEAQKQHFEKTKYSILPSNSELEGRSPGGWLRPLKRISP